ncbi:hypothetical protein V8B97DRAFT_2002870 [Scleroderma yunnanense]
MRLTLLGSLVLFVVAAAAAPIPETNAQRLARGLPPMPPANAARAFNEEKRHYPSKRAPAPEPAPTPSNFA